MRTEPIRYTALVAGLLTATATVLTLLGQGTDLLTALGTAIAQLALIVGGGELARTQAWAPESVDRILDAESVLSEAEAQG